MSTMLTSLDERHGGIDALRGALAGLPAERLARLTAAISDPAGKVTVGLWHPNCPMRLAGYGPDPWAPAQAAELVFCRAWDAFAAPAPRRFGLGRLPRVACREDVAALRGLAIQELERRDRTADPEVSRGAADRADRWHRSATRMRGRLRAGRS